MLIFASLFAGLMVAADDARPPNVVVIFADDLAYADIGPFGATRQKTPHLDRMAAEGVKFTDFYVPQAVCSASRAGLLTGCYPNRIGIAGALGPASGNGIHANELTLGELFKSRGYATAAYGKWHLGHHRQFLPKQNGFDDYFGLPYSNDMWPRHPETPRIYPPLPLIDGNDVVETNPDQRKLTTAYTERAVQFIRTHKEQPFFVYLAHSMPHVPLFVSDKFADTQASGLFGDVISEIDWSVGQILDTLRTLGLAEQTLVVFTSDNGPWLSYGDHAGSAGPLREGKGTSFEGGVREPTLFWWPSKLPTGKVQSEPALTLDLLPTLARLIGADLPAHPIDGKDIWPLMTVAEGAVSPHEAIFYYWGNHLQAVRSGPWKLHFPHDYRTLAGKPGGTGGIPSKYSQAKIGLSLFNLREDIGESIDVAAAHPEVVARLQGYAERMRRELGDSAMKQAGAGVRPAGRLGQ